MPLSSAQLKSFALEQGFEFAGICDAVRPPHYEAYSEWIDSGLHAGMDYLRRHRAMKAHPSQLLDGAKSILAVGLNYAQDELEAGDFGKVSIYAWGRDYHKVIRAKLRKVSDFAKRNMPGLKTRICVDSAPIMDRDFAWLAGLGWYGKNSCLINTRHGSFFFIGLLLLDAHFDPDEPVEGSCGSCSACIDACPTGALELTSSTGVAKLNSARCISYLTIEHKDALTRNQEQMLSGWLFGCDICQTVCPFNRPRSHQPERARPTKEPDFAPRHKRVDLVWLARANCEDIRACFSGSALMRAGAGRLKRNASALLKHKQRDGA